MDFMNILVVAGFAVAGYFLVTYFIDKNFGGIYF